MRFKKAHSQALLPIVILGSVLGLTWGAHAAELSSFIGTFALESDADSSAECPAELRVRKGDHEGQIVVEGSGALIAELDGINEGWKTTESVAAHVRRVIRSKAQHYGRTLAYVYSEREYLWGFIPLGDVVKRVVHLHQAGEEALIYELRDTHSGAATTNLSCSYRRVPAH